MTSSTDANLYFADLKSMAKLYIEGRLIFFLGAGFNLADRPGQCDRSGCRSNGLTCQIEDCEFRTYLPNGRELRDHLLREFNEYRISGSISADLDLSMVSQIFDAHLQREELNRALDKFFTAPQLRPTQVHRFLASLCSRPAPKPKEKNRFYPLVVSTNYDRLVENELKDCDVLYYVPQDGGCFYRQSPGMDRPQPIERGTANSDSYSYLRDRPTLLKIHGSAPPPEENRSPDPNFRTEAYLISQDNYLDHLTGAPLNDLIPTPILTALQMGKILFLGYRLADWNVRIFLSRLPDAPKLLRSYGGTQKHWAISSDWPEMLANRSPYDEIKLLKLPLADFRAYFKHALASEQSDFAKGIVE